MTHDEAQAAIRADVDWIANEATPTMLAYIEVVLQLAYTRGRQVELAIQLKRTKAGDTLRRHVSGCASEIGGPCNCKEK